MEESLASFLGDRDAFDTRYLKISKFIPICSSLRLILFAQILLLMMRCTTMGIISSNEELMKMEITRTTNTVSWALHRVPMEAVASG